MGKPQKKAQKKELGVTPSFPKRLQASEAWGAMQPRPKVLYIELKQRLKGSNNGQTLLSRRDTAKALNVYRNTVGPWFNYAHLSGNEAGWKRAQRRTNKKQERRGSPHANGREPKPKDLHWQKFERLDSELEIFARALNVSFNHCCTQHLGDLVSV